MFSLIKKISYCSDYKLNLSITFQATHNYLALRYTVLFHIPIPIAMLLLTFYFRVMMPASVAAVFYLVHGAHVQLRVI